MNNKLWSIKLWIQGMSWHGACRFVHIMKSFGICKHIDSTKNCQTNIKLWSIKMWMQGMPWQGACRFVQIMQSFGNSSKLDSIRKNYLNNIMWSTKLWMQGMSWDGAYRFVCIMGMTRACGWFVYNLLQEVVNRKFFALCCIENDRSFYDCVLLTWSTTSLNPVIGFRLCRFWVCKKLIESQYCLA